MERELLTMVFAIKKFRSYLVGTKVVVYTDHATLKYLLTKKDAKPSYGYFYSKNLIWRSGIKRE
jgi:hypothetical protein